ncbi:MAG: RsiV family protein [Muribaculaceae bacterium]|nr:RsiV family protein [Muribaculaceae bacterium]
MKRFLPFALSASAVALALMSTSCGNTQKSPDKIVTYDGPTFFKPVMQDVVADTVFDFDGNKIETTRVSRYASVDDTNNFISLNIYASRTNDAINGALSKYIGEAVDAFSQIDDSVKEMPVDSALNIDAARMVNIADSTVTYFSSKVIPQAEADSVIAVNLAIELKPVWADDTYVTYMMSSQTYLGGAHGEDDIYLQSYDRKTGAPMGFYNLIPSDRQDAIRAQLLDIISRSQNMTVDQYLASVNQWIGNQGADNWTVKTFPIAHVALTGQGYVFYYPKYTIAPGSEGCPVYVVPIKK